MIGTKTRGILLSALALGALGLGGCATKKYVNEQVGVVDTRVSAHETKLGELDQTSREALERATAAGKLAEGKFMYSVVMSDDALKFPIGKASLSPEGQERLTAVAERLKGENKNVYVEIQGHTDANNEETAWLDRISEVCSVVSSGILHHFPKASAGKIEGGLLYLCNRVGHLATHPVAAGAIWVRRLS